MAIIDTINSILIFNFVRQYTPGKEWFALCFYAFNPAITLITSYHSNIDAFALFPLLIFLNLSKLSSRWIWAFGALSILVKHITTFYFLTNNIDKAKSLRQYTFWLGMTGLVFIGSFLPNSSAWEKIIPQVFGHSGQSGVIGLSLIIPTTIVTGLFFVVMTLLPIISKFWLRIDLPSALLLSSLAFIIFTPGFYGQYILGGLVFGSIFPSIEYLIFSVSGVIYLLDYYGFGHTFPLRHLIWWSAILFIFGRFRNRVRVLIT